MSTPNFDGGLLPSSSSLNEQSHNNAHRRVVQRTTASKYETLGKQITALSIIAESENLYKDAASRYEERLTEHLTNYSKFGLEPTGTKMLTEPKSVELNQLRIDWCADLCGDQMNAANTIEAACERDLEVMTAIDKHGAEFYKSVTADAWERATAWRSGLGTERQVSKGDSHVDGGHPNT